ncbi:hypothetical protein P7K49_000249 [Saguinus oedipus]|uniref:Uncharacterized protein n=1 Tax=Saguinus oedipus TaxID=9490 RepID=A0ABQ9WB57_SAGOE|nr:hypothetical protein P7K49_000249 [Saguinus oedipus]
MGEIEQRPTPGSRLGAPENSGISTLERGQKPPPTPSGKLVSIKIQMLDDTQEAFEVPVTPARPVPASSSDRSNRRLRSHRLLHAATAHLIPAAEEGGGVRLAKQPARCSQQLSPEYSSDTSDLTGLVTCLLSVFPAQYCEGLLSQASSSTFCYTVFS